MKNLTFLLMFLTLCTLPVEGSFIKKDGQWQKESYAPKMSLKEHYSKGLKAMESGRFEDALQHFKVVSVSFPNTSYAGEADYYIGVCYYQSKEYDEANKYFTKYLKRSGTGKHFEKALHFKFKIAQEFKEGARRHAFAWNIMPKWATGKGIALEMFDEISNALPHDELAARSLFAKGQMKRRNKDWRASTDAFKLVIERFGKHPLVVQAYQEIAENYLQEMMLSHNNPDLLTMAQINLKKFEKAFPGDEGLNLVREKYRKMQSFYAMGLYEVGRFYERKSKVQAAMVYYAKNVDQFPNTEAGSLSKKRLEQLKAEVPKKKAKKDKKSKKKARV